MGEIIYMCLQQRVSWAQYHVLVVFTTPRLYTNYGYNIIWLSALAFLLSESDDQLLFGNLPDMLSDESQAHDDDVNSVRISQTEIVALSDLKLEVLQSLRNIDHSCFYYCILINSL